MCRWAYRYRPVAAYHSDIREDEQRPFDLSGFIATSVAMVSLVAMELLGDRQPQGWQTLALLAPGLYALRAAAFPPGRWPMVRLDALRCPPSG
jgi:hypothetical protein